MTELYTQQTDSEIANVHYCESMYDACFYLVKTYTPLSAYSQKPYPELSI